jgi:hypothetical protein
MKQFILILITLLLFQSCQQDEVIIPTPDPNQNTINIAYRSTITGMISIDQSGGVITEIPDSIHATVYVNDKTYVTIILGGQMNLRVPENLDTCIVNVYGQSVTIEHNIYDHIISFDVSRNDSLMALTLYYAKR